MKGMRRKLLAASCCLIVILLAGCAASTYLGTKQETLEERVKNYMHAQSDGEWDHVYSFFHSSYRNKISKEAFVNRDRKLSFKRFEIEEITVLPSGDEATVKVLIDISMMGYLFPRAPQKQIWAKENGGWYVKGSDKTAPFIHNKSNPLIPMEKMK